MSRWPSKLLGEACEINPRQNGAERLPPSAEVSFVPMAALDESSGRIVDAEKRTLGDIAGNYTPFRDGDVLFAKITPCMENGKVAIARGLTNGCGFGSTEFHVLRCRDVVIPQWILAFLRQPWFREAAKANFTGTAGQQRVPVDFLRTVSIPVPPLPEQERIARILDDAEALRRLHAQSDDRTAELAPALFYEALQQGGEVSPERWRLETVAAIASGVAKGRKFNGRHTVEVPYLRVANVQAGHLDLSEIKTIEALPEEVEELTLRKGDVLLTEGGDFDKLGRGALWEHDVPNCIHQNHVFRVRVEQSKLLPIFFSNFLRTAEARAYFLGCAKKTTNLASINMTQLKGLPVPLLPLKVQHSFATRIAEIGNLETAQAASRKRLDDLFQSLLYRAFRGAL
jgi:type I restriction enzyme, S subunit